MSPVLTVSATDARLRAVDTSGGDPPLLFVNGGFGALENWHRVIRLLGRKYRVIRFDARARGKSSTSTDYSTQAAVDDIGRIVEATAVERPIVVAWSQGATLAVRTRHSTPTSYEDWSS